MKIHTPHECAAFFRWAKDKKRAAARDAMQISSAQLGYYLSDLTQRPQKNQMMANLLVERLTGTQRKSALQCIRLARHRDKKKKDEGLRPLLAPAPLVKELETRARYMGGSVGDVLKLLLERSQ